MVLGMDWTAVRSPQSAECEEPSSVSTGCIVAVNCVSKSDQLIRFGDEL